MDVSGYQVVNFSDIHFAMGQINKFKIHIVGLYTIKWVVKGTSDGTSDGRFSGPSHLIQPKDTFFTVDSVYNGGVKNTWGGVVE